jgi:periplasmic protein TonB
MYRLSVLFSLLLLMSSSSLSYAQNLNDNFYALDENWKGTTLDKAKYIAREIKINDTCYRWDSYNAYGPLIRSESFKDKKGTLLHGKFAYYDSLGRADSIGYYSNGLQDGTWYFFNEKGKIIIKKEYKKGALISVDEVWKEVAPKENQNDEKESEYPGGAPAWQRYLNRNLRYPQRAINIKKEGMVAVVFVVNTDGQTDDFTMLKSVELSLDDEALRVIKNSKMWVPAVQNGKNVKSYKVQPIGYRLQ